MCCRGTKNGYEMCRQKESGIKQVYVLAVSSDIESLRKILEQGLRDERVWKFGIVAGGNNLTIHGSSFAAVGSVLRRLCAKLWEITN